MDRETRPKKNQLKLAFSLWGITMLIAFYFLDVNFQRFIDDFYRIVASAELSELKNWTERAGVWGPAVIIAGMTLQMFLVFVPSIILTAFSILAYGPFWGILLVLISVTVASTVGFFVGRFLGPLTVERMIGKRKKDTLSFYVENYGIWVVLITRLSPAFSNDAISFLGGLFNMNYFRFIGATLSGTFLLTLLLAVFGGIDPTLEKFLITVSALSLLGLILFILFDKKMRRPS